jgi:hypothetical protein
MLRNNFVFSNDIFIILMSICLAFVTKTISRLGSILVVVVSYKQNWNLFRYFSSNVHQHLLQYDYEFCGTSTVFINEISYTMEYKFEISLKKCNLKLITKYSKTYSPHSINFIVKYLFSIAVRTVHFYLRRKQSNAFLLKYKDN